MNGNIENHNGVSSKHVFPSHNLPEDPSRTMDKVFNDSVHGHIKLPPLCVKIMDTAEFQRLRNIKQVGPAYLVYPGASHNRFEHSLGVCYLAGQFIDHLRKNSGPEMPEITDTEKLCVEIAGLCHDLGHGPFSHTWERFINPLREKRGLLKWEHESCSIEMFDLLIKNNHLESEFEKYEIGADEIVFIKELIQGKKRDKVTRSKPFLYQIVANKDNDIDVDKWDYFLRDGLHLNLHESFDYRRLFASSRVCRVPEDRSAWHVCYRDKDALNIWNMFQVRARLHYQSYQHPVVKSLETMIIDALTAADEANYSIKIPGGKRVRLSETQDNLEAWCRMTDHVLYDILYSTEPEFAAAREIFQRILVRDNYTLVAKTRIDNKNMVPQKHQLLAKYCEDTHRFEPEEFRFTEVKLDFGSATVNPFEKVYFYAKNSPNKAAAKDIDEIPLFPINSSELLRTDLLLFCTRKKSQITEADCEDIQKRIS